MMDWSDLQVFLHGVGPRSLLCVLLSGCEGQGLALLQVVPQFIHSIIGARRCQPEDYI